MTDNSSATILVDLSKDRIRIHKKTLHALGDPECILLIVNPGEKTLGIIRGQLDDKGVHRVRYEKLAHGVCYELYSKPLVRKLREVCPEWNDGCSYRLNGEFIQGQSIAHFNMKDAVAIKGNQVIQQ